LPSVRRQAVFAGGLPDATVVHCRRESGAGAQVLQITAAADEADGPPEMRVYLDGRLIGDVEVAASQALDKWQEFGFRSVQATPVRELRILFPITTMTS
jgi:hypothetical protein